MDEKTKIRRTEQLHECGLPATGCIARHGWPAFFARRDEREKMLVRDRSTVARLSSTPPSQLTPNGRSLLRQLAERVSRTETMLGAVARPE